MDARRARRRRALPPTTTTLHPTGIACGHRRHIAKASRQQRHCTAKSNPRTQHREGNRPAQTCGPTEIRPQFTVVPRAGHPLRPWDFSGITRVLTIGLHRTASIEPEPVAISKYSIPGRPAVTVGPLHLILVASSATAMKSAAFESTRLFISSRIVFEFESGSHVGTFALAGERHLFGTFRSSTVAFRF